VAEDKGSNPAFAPEIGDHDDGEADFLFRAQMGAYNFFAGYWPQLLGVLGVFLVLTLAYSLYSEHVRDTQRDLQARIADVDRKMPQPDPMAAMFGSAGEDSTDENLAANLREGARRYVEIANEGSGTATIMAWQRAADAYERVGDTEQAISSLQSAYDAQGARLLGWSVASRLASMKVSSGDVEGAVALFQAHTAGEDFVAQHASLELGLLQESSGRSDEALTTLLGFLERFPDSLFAEQAAEALSRLQG
jgi:tetratricopeptide (TPR) repeat protein